MRLTGWGRFPAHECTVAAPRDSEQLRDLVAAGSAIARGNGRAYGDSAISVNNTIDMGRFNRMLAFDEETGRLTVEAGVLLADVIETFLPRGWFPPVTPGTKFVTIGGMIAADVHGKNHHGHGSFGSFVDWLELVGPDGEPRRCSKEERPDLFEWTVGGMGLTGVILRAAFRLAPVESGWIRQRALALPSLTAAMEAFERFREATYSVAWIDSLSKGSRLGRSLLILGEHAALEELPERKRLRPYEVSRRRSIPLRFDAPSFLFGETAVRLFNGLYYRSHGRAAGERLVDWDSYFYPLDRILGWNRLYGRNGLVQFQCVLPLGASAEGLTALLKATARARQGSFLAVLKRFGAQKSRFSFPMEGYTLALDFPVSKRSLALMDELDRITIEHGGRLCLAKDARMSADTLYRSDRRAGEFAEMRRSGGFEGRFASAQSERLGL